MKNNILKLLTIFIVFALFLAACSGSRQGYSDRRSSHNHGVDNRRYKGY